MWRVRFSACVCVVLCCVVLCEESLVALDVNESSETALVDHRPVFTNCLRP